MSALVVVLAYLVVGVGVAALAVSLSTRFDVERRVPILPLEAGAWVLFWPLVLIVGVLWGLGRLVKAIAP